MYGLNEPNTSFPTGQFEDPAILCTSPVANWVASRHLSSSDKILPELDTVSPWDDMIPTTPASSLGSASPPSSTISVSPSTSSLLHSTKAHTRHYQKKKHDTTPADTGAQSLKRRIQNRAAQRSFRERQKDYVAQLEREVDVLKTQVAELQSAYMELESTKLSSQIGAYSTFAAPTSSPQWASVPTMSPGSDGMFSPEMSELEFGNEMENVPPLPPSVPQSPYDIFLPYEAKGVYDGVPLMFGARPQLEIRI